jgi:hypothetical protein
MVGIVFGEDVFPVIVSAVGVGSIEVSEHPADSRNTPSVIMMKRFPIFFSMGCYFLQL